MSLTKAEVQKIANLARLGLNEAELEKFAGQLTGILEFVEILGEVNTDGIEPTNQVTGLLNVTEKDEVNQDQAKPDDLISCSPLEVEARQIVVKSVF